MTIRDIAVAFGFEVDKKSEKQAENSIKGIKNMATKLLGAIGIGFSIAGLGNLAEAAANAKALKSQFSQVFGDIEEEAAGRLEAIADDTGVAVNRMKGSFVRISAFAKTTGMETEDALNLADRSMVAIADSAAFYDRSLEEVTDSLQSFLKGNYEQDASLGLSCTEVTRNTASNELYGKSFKDLAENQKQLTLLKMVEDANKASGALGQAARESDAWTNQLGNLKQNLKGFKAAAGSTFLKPAVAALKMLSNLTKTATDKLEELTGEGGALTLVFDRMHSVVKRLKPSIDRMMQTLSRGAAKGISFVKGIVDRLGGVENVLKIAAIAAAAFFAVMSVAKIMGLIKVAGGMIAIFKKLANVFSLAKLKVMAIVAVITILALILEDFINFMLGNDSVIGAFFDKAGIGADNARQAIIEAWERVRDSLLEVWEAIKQALIAVWGVLYEVGSAIFNAMAVVIKTVFSWLQVFWSNWGSQILSWFKTLWDNLGGILNGFLEIVKGVANFISSVFTGDWQGAWEAIKQIFTGIWEAIVNFITAVLETIKLLFDMALSAISAIWNAIWSAISNFFMGIWNGIVSFLSGILNMITSAISSALTSSYNTVVSILQAMWNFFSTIFSNVAALVSTTFSNMLSGITTTVTSIKDAIVNGFNEAIDFIKGLPAQAVQWGADFINGLKNGITSGVQGIVDVVKGIGDKIRSFLHFSVPDEGPLTDYESWMPDFMEGMAKGIEKSEDTVLDKIKGVANGISMLMKGATASASTAGASTINNTTSSITQNVNIDNTYSGGSTETQKNVSRAMKKSAVDATTQMARGLAYARG